MEKGFIVTETLFKLSLGVLFLTLFLTTLFLLLPQEYASLPLSTWHNLLNEMVDLLSNMLGLFAPMFDVALLLIVLKIAITMLIVGFNIKLFQWVIQFVYE